MNYLFVLVVFTLLFLMDFKELQQANLNEKIVYGILLLAALTYAMFFEARFTTNSIVTVIARIVGLIRGISLPPQFY
ncbi:MAG: hypothetical protein PHD88_06975 [Firmicutes bacterium]|nr:hypothetical protein [Bacillota bacterium]MDD4263200.1 hypothetical protein [Bacillota bacterium]MDD4694124.1 hypothetical protein [Bacillota bacterium]